MNNLPPAGTRPRRLAAFAPSPAEPLPHQLLAALAQHRMATTAQLQTLLRPHAARQTISAPLNRLHTHGLIGYTVLPRSHGKRAWYLTTDGARLTRDWPYLHHRPHPITTPTAASMKTPHVLTVVRAHLAFITDARRRHDEHGYLDWTPEVAHPLSNNERIIADALMYYVLHRADGSRTKLRALIEVDRATTSSERLATKLIDYARLHTYTPTPPGRRPPTHTTPLWQRWYPVFPRILFILTGASPTTLTHRIDDLQAMTAHHPAVTQLAHTVPLGAATLHDLEHHHPTSPIWTPLNSQGPHRSWTAL
ncbi:replication-relaxation family protein [Streptomyces sp. NPDC001691]|uniref:replication-relaxation family protein n=1 Tax=Streptomyces sp. NPDC001691 TaxID=3364600 RepID=UPI0036A03FD7